MLKAGYVLENPVTGERAVIRRILFDEPGASGERQIYTSSPEVLSRESTSTRL